MSMDDFDGNEVDILDWNLNLLSFSKKQLRAVVYSLFDSLGLVSYFGFSPSSIHSFVHSVQMGYNANPFHNFWHSVTVTHMSYLLLQHTTVAQHLTPQNKLNLIVSSLCHDLDHPGNTNGFEVNSCSQLAILYNDKSVLESHHCSQTFLLLRKMGRYNLDNHSTPPPSSSLSLIGGGGGGGGGLYDGLGLDVWKESRKEIIEAILATDMSMHFQLHDQVSTYYLILVQWCVFVCSCSLNQEWEKERR